MTILQIPPKASTSTYTRSTDFQANFKEVGYMDRVLENRLKYNKDAAAILAVRHSCRVSIPYGRWTCQDGVQVIFNREYQPMFKRKDDVNTFALPDEYIENIVKVEYFYGDHNTPVDYLLRKFKDKGLGDATVTKGCRKSLAICLKILEDYYPKNTSNYKQSWCEFKIK